MMRMTIEQFKGYCRSHFQDQRLDARMRWHYRNMYLRIDGSPTLTTEKIAHDLEKWARNLDSAAWRATLPYCAQMVEDATMYRIMLSALNQPLIQLVLFPGIIGTDALPLDQCLDTEAKAQKEEPNDQASVQPSDQLPLFPQA